MVWNVVFDHVIVVAGREYLRCRVAAALAAGPYPRMDDWMRPAITRGLWIATASSAVILLVGLAAVHPARASRRSRPSCRPQVTIRHELAKSLWRLIR